MGRILKNPEHILYNVNSDDIFIVTEYNGYVLKLQNTSGIYTIYSTIKQFIEESNGIYYIDEFS